MMQITDLQKEQQILPILRLGFRPFFLGGTIFGFVSILLWLLTLRGVITPEPLGGSYWWHMHEMTFGFASAIIAGFLLTAVQTWTGLRGVQGKQLLFLVLLWLFGRFVVFMPNLLGNTLSSVIDLVFLPCVAFMLARPIIAIKQYRNLFFIPLLTLFTLANLEMHLSISYPTSFNGQLSGYASVILITFLMSVMGGRVVPMFTANGTKTQKATPIIALEYLANGSLALIMVYLLLHPLFEFNQTFFGLLLVVAGISQTIRCLRWRPWVTLSVPLVWSLHLALKFIWFGLIMLGISYLLPQVPSNHLWHLLTIGGIGGLILAMISRVSLGHTGRPLTPEKIMSVAFMLMAIATLVRSFGPWLAPEKTLMFYDISGLFWLISLAIFIVIYGPMLLTPRQDGRPG